MKKILSYNTIFSTLNGVAMFLWPQQIASIFFATEFNVFGLSPAFTLHFLGAGLVIFAAYVGFVAFKLPHSINQVKIIIAGDWSWVLSTILLFVFFNDIFSLSGIIFFTIAAIIVTGFALLQMKFLKK